MASREHIEKVLAEISRRRDEAEAEALHAAESLIRLASGLTPLDEVDPDAVRAAADDFAEAAQRFKMLNNFARVLRGLLI